MVSVSNGRQANEASEKRTESLAQVTNASRSASPVRRRVALRRSAPRTFGARRLQGTNGAQRRRRPLVVVIARHAGRRAPPPAARVDGGALGRRRRRRRPLLPARPGGRAPPDRGRALTRPSLTGEGGLVEAEPGAVGGAHAYAPAKNTGLTAWDGTEGDGVRCVGCRGRRGVRRGREEMGLREGRRWEGLDGLLVI